jgi:Trk K+ transport system NAD-binding subunit
VANLLLSLATRPFARRRRGLRKVAVGVPTTVQNTDAVFLVLRRMRAPLVVLIGIFAISVAGLTMIPGVDGEGHPYRMTVFDAFYFMSYTATTIGFGELPYAFTAAQRLWVTMSIYSSVIGWAYSIGTLFSLMQDDAFRMALATQQFRRRVRRLHEPFFIVVGYGHAGRTVCQVLDLSDHRFVVIDEKQSKIELMQTDQLTSDAPGFEGDARKPAVLGLAGLGHKHCEGVLVLTDDDEANLAVVMACHLLRPELPVIARCGERSTAEHMHDFEPRAVINPYDRYGEYLVHPTTFQLVSWLMSESGDPLPRRVEGLHSGRWVVCADGTFGREVAHDLESAGLEVTMADPKQPLELEGVVGLIAGSDQDTTNLAVAAHARRMDPSIFVSVRQRTTSNMPLLEAFALDSVFIPTQLVARECLTRIVTPAYWSVVEHAVQQSDAESQAVIDRLLAHCGNRLPQISRVSLSQAGAPAVVRWMREHPLRLGDLLRDPQDRDRELSLVPLVIVRQDGSIFDPDGDVELAEGDDIIIAARDRASAVLSDTLFHDASIEYVATGRQVPSTWLWRRLVELRTRRSSG